MATYGMSCTDRASNMGVGGFTIIPGGTRLNATNVHMTSVCLWIDTIVGSSSITIKLMKNTSGNVYEVTSETTATIVTGQNTFTVNLYGSHASAVDWIVAVYFAGTVNIDEDSTAGTMYWFNGNATGSQTFTQYGGGNATISLSCQMVEVSNDVYVNSSTGADTNAGDSCTAGHPVLTFGKAYDLLNTGGTIHVCNDADFSGETVALNKSFSVDRNGSAGYFYMPKTS